MKGRPDSRRTLSPDNLRERGWTVPGSIRRRGNSYVLRLYVGCEGGRKRWKWFTFGARAEAEAAQRELASHTLAHAAGTGIFGSPRERLGPYLTDWLDRQTRLASKTRCWYEVMVGQIQQDILGGVPLAKLTPRAFEGYYTRLLKSGKSPTTVLHHHRLLHKALRDAERQDLVMKNPVAQAEAPKRARVRLNVWTESQTLLFLSEAKAASHYYPLYLFLVGTGVRIGEALGVTWHDLSTREGTVTIAQALQRPRGGGYTLKNPKTLGSERTIALPDEVMTSLRVLRAHQDEEIARREPCTSAPGCRRQHCTGAHALDLVFCQPNGKPLFDNNIRLRDLYPLCQQLGLPWRRAFHNFRHAHGSHLLQRGVSVKVVQERLGHKTAAFTLSTYAHVLHGMQAQAAQAVSAMLNASTSLAPPTGNGHRAETLDK